MSTFYELIDRALLIVIGFEFVRMLIVHKLVSVLELLAFVVARKMLKPDMSSIDMAFGSFAFVLLLSARYGIEYYHHRTGIMHSEVKH